MLYYSSFTCWNFISETSKKNTQINFWLEIILVTYIVIYWVEKSHYCIEHNFTYLESFMVGTIPLFLPGNSTTFRGNTLSSLSTSLSFWMISLVWFFFSLKMRMFHFHEFFLKYIKIKSWNQKMTTYLRLSERRIGMKDFTDPLVGLSLSTNESLEEIWKLYR